MTKCIILEYPDGSIATRGGFGPISLASFLLLMRDGARRPVSLKEAQKLLAAATAGEVQAARATGLQYVLDELVPKQNLTFVDPTTGATVETGVIARIEDVTFPTSKTFRGAWKRGIGKIEVDMPKARLILAARIGEAKRAMARDLIERETVGEDVTADKAALRAIDVQAQIDAATTPEALMAIWPALLPS